MIKKLFLILFLFVSFYELKADKSYPLSVVSNHSFDGKLFTDGMYSYCIINDWARGNFTITKWQGIEKEKAEGKLFENIEIRDVSFGKTNLLVYKEFDRYYLGKFDNDLNIEKIHEFQFRSTDDLEIRIFDSLAVIKNGRNIFIYNYVTKFKKEYNGVVDLIKYQNKFYLLKQFGSHSELIELEIENYREKERLLCKVEMSAEKASLLAENNQIVVLANFTNSTYINTYDLLTKTQYSQFLEVDKDNISVHSIDTNVFIYFLQNKEGVYYLVKSFLNKINNPDSWYKLKLPSELIESSNTKILNENIIILFKNGIYIADLNLKPIASDNFRLEEDYVPEYYDASKYLVLQGKNKSLLINLKKNPFWFIFRFWENYSFYFIPFSAVLMLFLFIQLYRSQRRLLNVILDLPSTGFVIVLDKEGNILRINDLGMDLMNLNYQVPLKKYYKYYFNDESFKSLEQVIETALNNKTSFNQKITIVKDYLALEFICNVVVLRNTAGFDRGVVITGLDITEELERKRLSNWAQLAHDLQTNLSTVRLNAEQMEFAEDNPNSNRQRKILHQVNIVINRVRDIITVGRGDVIEINPVAATELFREVKSEFEMDFGDSIEMQIEESNVIVPCDRKRILRAIRNATENAIKILTKTGGKITFSAINNGKFILLSIKDNGPGMRKEIKENMLNPFFTSGEQGGTGIGTMIMKNVVEQHGGSILINSELNVGTEIIFKIPNKKANV